MKNLNEPNLEWAHKHLQKFSHSDFYPRLFEYPAVTHNWQEVKKYILSLDLETYEPKSPNIYLAPKNNGNYRVVHQLDPIDSLIYTALIREICEVIEQYRIPEEENIVCSYRIKPTLYGSFFTNENGWDLFVSRSNELAEQYKRGYMITADITDFYNQIYTHRINNLIVEAGKGDFDQLAQIIEKFLLSINKKTTRGIPVGPAPSIILAELIMGSIDKKICNYTRDFVRYVDDIRMFFERPEQAFMALHELTDYLYSYHRLVFSGEKTRILQVNTFVKEYMIDEKRTEKNAVMSKADELTSEKLNELMAKLPPYGGDFDYSEEYERVLSEILNKKQFELLSSTYFELLEKSLKPPRDYGMIRHILRQSTSFRIRAVIPLVLDNFYVLRPVIREAVIYLNAIINERVVIENQAKFEMIRDSFFFKLPFLNMWVSYLFQNDSFNKVDFKLSYESILTLRARAMLAIRLKDTTWVREFRDKTDTLGIWDKRAVLYSNIVLPYGEMRPLVQSIAMSGDIIDKSIASYLISKKRPNTAIAE